jgi:Ras-related protein Rab-1A
VEHRFFEEDETFTIGHDIKRKTVEWRGRTIKLILNDTAGQERFRTVTASFYRGCNGIIIVYDICSTESFERVPDWLSEARGYTNDDIAVILVGNKIDLDSDRTVSFEEAKSFADREGLAYFETSAKMDINVGPAFMHLIDEICTARYA